MVTTPGFQHRLPMSRRSITPPRRIGDGSPPGPSRFGAGTAHEHWRAIIGHCVGQLDAIILRDAGRRTA